MINKLLQKIGALTCNISLLLNSFLPYVAAIPAYAVDSAPIAYNNSSHQLYFSFDTANYTAYQLFYKTDTKIDSVSGSKLPEYLYLGTCSDGTCLPQSFQSAILKIKTNSGFYFYYFTLKNGQLQIVSDGNSAQLDLSDDELNLLEGITRAPTSAPTPEITVTPTSVPKVEQICLENNQVITDSTLSDWNRDDSAALSETKEKVRLGVKYNFPQENKVSVTFKCLPKDESLRTALKIQQIKASELKLPENFGNVGEYAYDITTGMTNGAFEYDVTLPKAENSTAEISYIEKSADDAKNNEIKVDEVKQVEESKVEQQSTSVKALSLDHFTLFIISNGALLSVSGSFNGVTQVTVDPNTSIEVDLNVERSGGDSNNDWESTSWKIDEGSWICEDHADHEWFDGTSSESFNITAPSTVGTYDVSFRAHRDDSCGNTGVSNTFTLTDGIIVSNTPSIVTPVLPNNSSDDYALTSVSGVWTSVSGGSNVIGTNTNEVRWGNSTGSGQSGLRFDGSGVQTFNTGSNFYLGALTHFNWPITNAANGAKLKITLQFSKPSISPNPDFSYDFVIDETTNNWPCSSGWQQSYTACDDKISFPTSYGSKSFTIDDKLYTLRIVGFVNSYPSGSPVSQFITEEQKNNTAYLVGTLSSVLVERPDISIIKKTNDQDISSAPGENLNVGDAVNWSYIIQNTGNVNLSGVSVVDNPTTPISCPKNSLLSGESMTCTASGTVQSGQFTNTATVTANHSTGTVSKSDSSWYFGIPRNICGDGVVNQNTEECDNGSSNGSVCTPTYGNSCNYCSVSCQNISVTGPYCGDGIMNGDEQCDGTDLGGLSSTDFRCNSSCQLELINTSVTICHATSASDNPYVTQSPNIQNNGDLTGGHLNHTGGVYPVSGWGDIIPPFVYIGGTFPGLNWTTEGQAIYRNGCKIGTTLKIIKTVNNTGGGSKEATDFEFSLNNGPYTNFGIGGSNEFSLNIGDTYTITENPNSDYSVVYNNCSGTLSSSSTTCTITNTYIPVCGDGIKYGQEECDDGNRVNTDDCTNDCRLARCGDGFLQAGEECEGAIGVTPGQNFCASKTCKLIPIYDGSDVCPRGTVKSATPIITKSISSTDADGESFSLTPGKKYLFEASGTFIPTEADGYKSDAGYTLINGSLSSQYGISGSGNDYAAHALLSDFGTGTVGVVNWGIYNPSHTYSKYLSFPDTSSNIQFVIGDRYADWFDTQYQNQAGMNDNSDSLTLNVYECQNPPVKIYAQKVVCDNESFLPNDTQGNITASTAQNWVNNSNGHCRLVDGWDFQYGGVGTYGDFQSNTASLPGWQTMTTVSGIATATINDLSSYGGKIEVREVFPDNSYVPFSNSSSNVSAEIYCTGDAANYDNWEWINNPQYGQDYYCVAFNAAKQAKLTVIKQVDTDNDGVVDNANATDWKWDIARGEQNIATGQSRILGAGTYVITEDQKNDYQLKEWTCTNETRGTTNSISVALNPGDDITCTITNTRKTGSIRVCKVILDASGNIVDGSALPVSTFSISGLDQSTSQGAPAGVLGVTNFVTPLSYATKLFGSSVNNALCTTYSNLIPGNYYYGEESISNNFWAAPKYNDGASIPRNINDNFYEYSGQLFDDNSGNDGSRQTASDGHIVLAAGQQNRTLIILNQYKYGNINITKFNDYDGDGFQDDGEENLSGWTINLTGQTSVVTDNSGLAAFNKINSGDYVLSETIQTGWIQTNISCDRDGIIDNDNSHQISLTAGQTLNCKIGNRQLGNVTVYKFNDLNGNGTKDEGENNLSGWTINLTGQSSVSTNESGQANFNNLLPGNYDLSENLDSQPGWTQTNIYCDGNDGPGVKITREGEAYGHHGNCEGWNGCGNAATCALWACEVNGYDNLVSYGADKPCTEFGDCNLFYNRTSVDMDWRIHCGVRGVTDIVCSNGSASDDSEERGFVSGNRVTVTPGQNKACYIGNQRLPPRALISKWNNANSSGQASGSSVEYKIKVKILDNNVSNFNVTDLLSNGFVYRPGTYNVTSSRLGDITSSIDEPQYHSPGVWHLENLQAGDEIELSYIADISSDQQPGTYSDLAYALGDAAYDDSVDVLATSEPIGYVDENFSGTEVIVTKSTQNTVSAGVEKEEVRQEGQVLGASTELPSTGSSTSWLIISTLMSLLGFALIKKSKKILIVLLFTSFFISPNNAEAISNLSLRVEQPKTPTNLSDVNLNFVALDILSRPVTVKCYQKYSTDADFTQFGTDISLTAGGNANHCSLSSVLTNEGSYQLKVVAFAGADSTESILSLDYKTSGPSTPIDYRKEHPNNCDYTIHFKTADDGGKTAKVEVYRSDSTSFNLDSGSFVTAVNIGSNQEHDLTNSVPDCSKNYYYVLRAFDNAGNGSGTTGDSVVKIVTSTTTTTSNSSTTSQGAIPVTNATIAPETSGTETITAVPTLSPEEGSVLGTQNKAPTFIQKYWLPLALALIAGIAIIRYVFVKRKSSN